MVIKFPAGPRPPTAVGASGTAPRARNPRVGLRAPPSKSRRWTWGEVFGSRGEGGGEREVSRAHLEQGRVRAPPGEGSAPGGRKGAAWVGDSSTSLPPHPGPGLAASASQAAAELAARQPAARSPARRPASSCANPRATGSAPCRTLPSAAAPPALAPRPGARAVGNGGGDATGE